MRVAVIGAGAAGMYAVESLLERREFAVEIDLYERLPTPWGLVRAGVAPDHPEKKQVCDRQFDLQLKDARVRFIGNVAIGRDVTADRKSVVSGKSVSVRVDLGGRRFIKKTKLNS